MAFVRFVSHLWSCSTDFVANLDISTIIGNKMLSRITNLFFFQVWMMFTHVSVIGYSICFLELFICQFCDSVSSFWWMSCMYLNFLSSGGPNWSYCTCAWIWSGLEVPSRIFLSSVNLDILQHLRFNFVSTMAWRFIDGMITGRMYWHHCFHMIEKVVFRNLELHIRPTCEFLIIFDFVVTLPGTGYIWYAFYTILFKQQSNGMQFSVML